LEDIAAAKEFSEAFLELTTNEHYFFFEALAWAFKGRILFREGKHQDAIASIQKGLEMDQMTGMVVSQEIFLHALAEAYCAAGQAEDGLEVILKAEQAEEKTGDARFKSFLQRIKGELYLLTGDEVAAEEAYLAAIATAQKQSAKLLELEAVKKLARLWHKQGKTQQAIEKLAEVYNWFTEGFDTPMLVRARELLEKMKGEVKG
jgi:tetratricopeptide (TPR) repeat protein